MMVQPAPTVHIWIHLAFDTKLTSDDTVVPRMIRDGVALHLRQHMGEKLSRVAVEFAQGVKEMDIKGSYHALPRISENQWDRALV